MSPLLKSFAIENLKDQVGGVASIPHLLLFFCVITENPLRAGFRYPLCPALFQLNYRGVKQ